MTDPITVPMEARLVMQKALWERCIRPADNEWTTWTDAIVLAECAATALWEDGWTVVRSDSWRLRSDFGVVPLNDGSDHA
jgi:hypothetical protein